MNSFHNNYFNLALSSFSAPGSHQLVFIAYYLVLSFLLMYSSSGLSTDAFSLLKRIYTQVMSQVLALMLQTCTTGLGFRPSQLRKRLIPTSASPHSHA